MSKTHFSTAFVLMAISMAFNLNAQETKTINFEHFSLDQPIGFAQRPDMAMGNPDLLAVFVSEEPFELSRDQLITVSRLEKMIARDPFTADELPFKAEIVEVPWKSFRLQTVIRRDVTISDSQMVNLVIQIPLKPVAIQLGFQGPVDEEAQILEIARDTLKGIDGESNWYSEKERFRALGNLLGYLLFAVVAIVIGVGFIGFIIRQSGVRKSPTQD